MKTTPQRGLFVRMFSSALASQVVLSAASFAVGLMLIRRTSDLQYGYYVLVAGVLLLATSLQNSFIAPAMIGRMVKLSSTECGDLTGGLYREQRQLIAMLAGLMLMVILVLWMFGPLRTEHLLLGLASIAAAMAAMRREFFRMVLLAYRRAHAVLRGDLLYALLLSLGVLAATFGPMPAALAMLALAAAAIAAGALLSSTLRRNEPWNIGGEPGILRQILPIGAWSTSGAAIHWSFSQGYAFLIAATLDIAAVAAVAATRLLVMPVNLLSTGIGSLMLPLTARWLEDHETTQVLRRLLAFALGIATVAVIYFAVLWWFRDWVFANVLTKQFEQRDMLLLLWSAGFVVMAINQQLMWLLIARARFRMLSGLGLVSATTALSCAYVGMLHYGPVGAPMGILVGELVQGVGIVALCLREVAPWKTQQEPVAELSR